MNKILVTSFIVQFVIVVYVTSPAQVATPADRPFSLNSFAENSSVFRSFDNRYKGVKGGITYLENYVPGIIFMSKGQVVKHDKINYDAFNDELVVFYEGKEAGVNKLMVNSFLLITGIDSLYFDRVLGPDNKVGFFQRLNNEKKVILYKKVYKKLIEPDYRGAYSQGRDYAELVTEQKYMFLDAGKKRLMELKSKKLFSEDFPENKDMLDAHVKKEKIDFKKEEDLKQLFKYLNEIRP